jgi:hypothetical protein
MTRAASIYLAMQNLKLVRSFRMPARSWRGASGCERNVGELSNFGLFVDQLRLSATKDPPR